MAESIDRGDASRTARLDSPHEDLKDKGLEHDAVGLLASVVLGVSCVAPAYALTATLGPTVSEVGLQMPAIFLAGFIPMLLVAYAYRELNHEAPDCGTSFTWTVKAFGPHVGWMCGWGFVLATVIVLSNLVGVAVTFFYLLLGNVLGNPAIEALGGNAVVNVLTTLVFVAAATAISYRGMAATKGVQYLLVGLQMVVLALFIALAFGGALGGASELAIGFSWSWLNPFAIESFAAFAAGLSLSIFIYWGWDTTLTINEETTGSSSTPGRAALLTILTILSTYMLVAISAQMFAGIGEQGIGLGNPDTADNVFAALAEPVLGVLAIFLFLAVAGERGVEPADHVLARGADDARHVLLQGGAGAFLARAPAISVAVLRDAFLRRGHGDLLHRNDVPKRGCPDRHHLRARVDDRLLLLAHGLCLRVVLSQGAVHEPEELHLQGPLPWSRRVNAHAPLLQDGRRYLRPGLRQRRSGIRDGHRIRYRDRPAAAGRHLDVRRGSSGHRSSSAERPSRTTRPCSPPKRICCRTGTREDN